MPPRKTATEQPETSLDQFHPFPDATEATAFEAAGHEFRPDFDARGTYTDVLSAFARLIPILGDVLAYRFELVEDHEDKWQAEWSMEIQLRPDSVSVQRLRDRLDIEDAFVEAGERVPKLEWRDHLGRWIDSESLFPGGEFKPRRHYVDDRDHSRTRNNE